MARPRKLNPELTAKIVERIIEGNRPQVAANLAGVSSSTFFDWMSKGKNLEAEFLEFSESVERGFAESVVQRIATIHRAATKGDWRASAYWLEKNCPEIYGKQRAGKAKLNIGVKEISEIVTIEELHEKVELIAKLRSKSGK